MNNKNNIYEREWRDLNRRRNKRKTHKVCNSTIEKQKGQSLL